ncbi:MAG: hypothetical protein C4554_00050 [Dethiobacter sp.]|nr:MAG: hypothetical protein C4554_00050 [Dethiobacter sp.]
MKAIKNLLVPQFIDALAKDMHLLAPVKKGNNVYFKTWQSGMELEWRRNSFLPPKDLFFPQMDLLYKYSILGQNGEIQELTQSEGPRAIVGIRNCDLKSITLLDKVFLSEGFEDPAYRHRRDNTVLIAYNCSKPQPACFCTSLGINPQGGEGADLVLFELEQEDLGKEEKFSGPGPDYGIEARTPKGEEILKKQRDYVHDTHKKAVPFQQCPLSFGTDGILEKLQEMFEHSLWDDLSKRCLRCGICTYVCPTCHCFDIQGKNAGEEGFKYRCWDSCMFSDYTLMAGGHDPRPTRMERFRNRFLHKLWFYKERYGEFLCTGCGRCLSKCPVHLDISYVAGKIKEAVVDVR